MLNVATHIVSGRIVSGNPFGSSTIIDDSGKKEILYQITIAVKKDSEEMKTFYRKVEGIIKQQWPDREFPLILGHDFDWEFKDYDEYIGSDEPYVDYCLGCCLIGLRRKKQSPLTIMPDGQGGWQYIKHSGVIKTGDYVKVELELIPNGDNVNPGLHFEPNFVALIEGGAKVDLEQDTDEKHREISLEKVSKALGRSPDLVNENNHRQLSRSWLD